MHRVLRQGVLGPLSSYHIDFWALPPPALFHQSHLETLIFAFLTQWDHHALLMFYPTVLWSGNRPQVELWWWWGAFHEFCLSREYSFVLLIVYNLKMAPCPIFLNLMVVYGGRACLLLIILPELKAVPEPWGLLWMSWCSGSLLSWDLPLPPSLGFSLPLLNWTLCSGAHIFSFLVAFFR